MYSQVPNIKTHSMKSSIPQGWRVMTLEEGKANYKSLLPLLGAWSIVGFDRGKIDGSGYGSKISDTRGSECGEIFIIQNVVKVDKPAPKPLVKEVAKIDENP